VHLQLEVRTRGADTIDTPTSLGLEFAFRTSRSTYFELEVRAWPLQGFSAGSISSIRTVKQ
jgi:hypothetical protein